MVAGYPEKVLSEEARGYYVSSIYYLYSGTGELMHNIRREDEEGDGKDF